MHGSMMRGSKVPNSVEILKQKVSYEVATGFARPVVATQPPATQKKQKPFMPLTMAELAEQKMKTTAKPAKFL